MVGVIGRARVHSGPVLRPLLLNITQGFHAVCQFAGITTLQFNRAFARDVGQLPSQQTGCSDTATTDNFDHRLIAEQGIRNDT